MPGDLPYPVGTRDYAPGIPNTVPPGRPKDTPPAAWTMAQAIPLSFEVDGTNPAVFSNAYWRTPIFDMRPDLGSLAQNQTDREPSARPMWGGSALHISLTVSQFAGLTVFASEWGHPTDVNQIAQITDAQDITAELSNTALLGGAAAFTYRPYSKIRYYQLRLHFQVSANYPTGAPASPTVAVTAGFY